MQNCYYSLQFIILFKSIDCLSDTFLEFCKSPFCLYDTGYNIKSNFASMTKGTTHLDIFK